MPVARESCASGALLAFLDSFVASYEQLRNLKPGDGPALTAPACRAAPQAEVQRAFALVDAAAREWMVAVVGAEPGAESVRGYLHQVPKIDSPEAAGDAVGLLQAAFRSSAGFSRVAIGEARVATSAAAEIETDNAELDNDGPIHEAAKAAGACLATAAYASTPPRTGIDTAIDLAARLV